MIRVRLNENTFVDVQGTNNTQDAAAAARRWFRENRPEEFEAWRQTQLGLGSSATRGLSAGIDQFQSTLFSAAEGLGRAVGSEGLESFGRAGRIEQQREAEAAFPRELRQPFTEVEDIGGAARATTEAITGSLPATGTGIAGALAGARAGAAGGLRGRIVGGILGGTAAAFPQLFGANIERQIQESGDIVSPGAAAAAAAVQAPLESAADVATLGAARLIRRPATEAAQAAGAGLGRRIATGAGVGALTETPVEVAQTALERAQAGLPVFTTEGGAGREYLEAGLGGLAAGTVTGGAVSGAFGQRPTAARTSEQETAALETMRQGSLPGEGAVPGAPISPAPAPAPAATSRFAPLTVPERPQAFATAEETEAFLAQNPNFPAPPAAMATPEARTAWVNAARQATYQREVGVLRQSAVSNFAATQPETFLGNLAQAAAEGNLKNLNSFTANDVVNAALRSSGIEPGRLTKEERQFANEQLTNLANAGILAKPTATSFSVSFAPRPEAAAPTAEPTPTRAEREAAQREVLELSAAAEAGTVGQITPFEARRLGAETLPREQAAPAEAAPTSQVAPAPPVPQAAVPPSVTPPTDPLYAAAVDSAASEGGATTRTLQRDLGVGYNRAARLREQLEQTGVIGPANNVGRSSFLGRPQAAAPAPAPAQPSARTTVEVNGVRRETTPETLQQTVDQMRAGQQAAPPPPTPQETVLAQAAAQAEPASGAGQTTATAEEAVLATPKNFTIKQQQQTLDKQREAMFEGPAEGFRGGVPRKWFASPLTGLARQPEYQLSAEQGTRLADRKLRATTEFTELYTPMQELSAESQARAMLTLQESRSRQQMWNRNAFTPEENRAMDNVLAMGQRGLDYYIDAATNKFFNPAEAKTPQDRARLEAFQRTKGDRLITQLSDAELRAASEAGAAEVRRMNQRRDQFYFPQVSKGTHFVAAYERLPGGKEKIARIYFYDPLNFAQRQRARVGAQRDFEALSVEALRREFPDTSRFRIMAKGREAENDSRVADLRRDGEFIARYLQELSQVSTKESKQILDRMAAEINKAQMDRFFKPNNDILRAVTPWNAVDYARETIPNYFLALSNIQGRLLIQDDFNRAMAGYSPEEKQFWNDWLNINSTPVEAFGTGRALAGAWFLGGNISTAMMQLTQNFVTLPARFARDGGLTSSARHMASAARDVYGTSDVLRVFGKEMDYTNRLIKRGILSSAEASALKRAILEGAVRPSQITNIRGQFEADTLRSLGVADQSAAKFASGANKVVDVSFRMLSTVDETNRAIAFLAAHRLATSNPEVMVRAGRLDNRTYATPYDYARAVVDETNFRGGVDDQPLITRFHPVAQMVTQFLTPSFKFIELFARSGAMAINGLKNSDPVMAKAGALQFSLMLAPQVILAGIWSLPFADRLKEIMEFFLKQAGMVVDLEQEIEKMGVNSLTASTINFGLLHALGAVTLSERLKIDILPQGSLSEWDVFSLLGPVGGLLEKPAVAHAAWQLGDYWGVGYALLPTSLANVLKGIQIGATGEQFTRRGGRIITPEDVQQAAENGAFPPALQQAIGFAPTEFTNIRRAVQRQRDLQDAVRDPTERVNIELSRILLRHYEARIAGRTEEADARAREFQQRAAEIEAEQRGKPAHLQVRVNPQAINQRALQDLQGRGSLEALLRRAPAAQREEILRMYGRTVNPQ